MDLLSLEAQAGAELKGSEAAGEESQDFLRQNGSAPHSLHHAHRTSPLRNGSEIRKNHPFSYLGHSHLHFSQLRWLFVNSKQDKKSGSHKEIYQSSDKKRDNISQSYFLLLPNTAVGKWKERVKGGELYH